MKKTLLLITIALLSLNLSFAQIKEEYAAFVKEAFSLYQAGSYQESADKYKEAFDVYDGKAVPDDRYNAACSYALAGDKETAFYHLIRLSNIPTRYSNYNHLITDSDLNLLHDDMRWEGLLQLVKANKAEAEKDLETPLVAMLDTIYQEDQRYRRQIGDIEEKYGRNSDEMKAHWKLIHTKDSINLIKVCKILDERGWLGPEVIGGQGNSTLFLVIQHSDLKTQEKYLPMMREAVKNKKASGGSLALLEDRVALGQGKRQIYGSQIGREKESGEYFVLPLEDPEKVDERRKEVGLGPIADYIKHWDMTWDVEKHKERTAKSEAAKKK